MKVSTEHRCQIAAILHEYLHKENFKLEDLNPTYLWQFFFRCCHPVHEPVNNAFLMKVLYREYSDRNIESALKHIQKYPHLYNPA